MPERLAYDEAMLFSSVRLKLADPDLKHGKVETAMTRTALGGVERPWGIEGGFAVVYKFRTRSGKLRALRCFRVPISQDMQFRYERMGAYFHTHAATIVANFTYYDAAILVKEQGKAQPQTYPLIDMEWIEGLTLVEKVDEACRQRDQAMLRQLGRQLLYVLSVLRQHHIAHGDLAGVNILVKPNGQLILVDYDSVYIPAFAGLTKVLLGQADFQHPQMAQRRFDEHMDDFSALVLYTALLALEGQPTLWDTYARRDARGRLLDTNLLFTQQDFKEPGASPLLRELEQASDPRVVAAAKELKRACLQPIDQVRFPLHLIEPDYEQRVALGQLEVMIRQDDDQGIVESWTPRLATYDQAQRYHARVELARQRVQSLQRFRTALQSQNIAQIIATYDAQLDASRSLTQQERQLLAFARSFAQTMHENEDALLTLLDAMQKANLLAKFTFTPAEQQAIDRAKQRLSALQQVRAALRGKHIDKIATAYDTVRNPAYGLTSKEREVAELASTFIAACATDDDEAIAAAYEAIENFSYLGEFLFTSRQQQRARLALQRRTALARLRVALTSKRPRQIASASNKILNECKNVTPTERELLALAQAFVQAYDDEEQDAALVVAYAAVQESPYRTSFTFTAQEQQRIAAVQRQHAALTAFQSALKRRRPREIAAAYDSLLDNNRQVTQRERELLAVACSFAQAYADDDDDALAALDTAIRERFELSPQEQQRLLLARRRRLALATFRKVITSPTRMARQIVAAYDASLLETSNRITQAQRARLVAAQNYLAMYHAIQKGITADDDALIRLAYNPTLAERFSDFSADEQRRIDRALLSEEIEEALLERHYGRAIVLAREIEGATGQSMSYSAKFKLQKALIRFIRQQDLTQLTVRIEQRAEGNVAVVSWQWPTDELIQHALIVWNAESWPPRLHNAARLNSGGRHVWVERPATQCEFPIAHLTHIYVQGYTAILDAWHAQHRWRFSDGIEPTSQAEATDVGAQGEIHVRY